MQVTCDICKKSFSPDIQETRTDELTLIHHRCPFCETGYLISVMDKECRNLQASIKSIDRRIEKAAKKYKAGNLNEHQYINRVKYLNMQKDKFKNKLKDRADRLKENIEIEHPEAT